VIPPHQHELYQLAVRLRAEPDEARREAMRADYRALRRRGYWPGIPDDVWVDLMRGETASFVRLCEAYAQWKRGH
jgi:hypothetical protein